MRTAAAALTLACLSGCGSSVVLSAPEDEQPWPTIDSMCGGPRIETVGFVDGREVAHEECIFAGSYPSAVGPFFTIEYSFEERINPLFLGEGDPLADDVGTTALALGVFEPTSLLGTDQPLCGGAGSTYTLREFGDEDPRVEVQLESLSRLGACTPGNHEVVVDFDSDTLEASLTETFDAALFRTDVASSGEFRLIFEGPGYLYAELAEDLPDEPGIYDLADAFVYDQGEFFCAGGGTLEMGLAEGMAIPKTLTVTGLGRSGTCPGEPVEGRVLIREVGAPP